MEKVCLNRVADKRRQRFPASSGIELVACRHKLPFQSDSVSLAIGFDDSAAAAQTVERDVSQDRQQRSLKQALQFGSIQRRSEMESGRNF